jgi:hypothetical protein
MVTPQLFILPSHFNGGALQPSQFFVEPSCIGPGLKGIVHFVL